MTIGKVPFPFVRKTKEWTRIYFDGPYSSIMLCIESKWMARAQRRTLMLALCRALMPSLPAGFRSGMERNSDDPPPFIPIEHPLRMGQALDLQRPGGNFGYVLRQRRLEVRLTQQDLAARAGLNRSQISRIEHAKTKPRPSTLRRLEQALERAAIVEGRLVDSEQETDLRTKENQRFFDELERCLEAKRLHSSE